MTNESLERAKDIKYKIEEIQELKRSLTPFINERVELTISWEKGLLSYLPDSDSKRKYILKSDDPLTLAILGALQDMLDELQEQFDSLDSNLPRDPNVSSYQNRAIIKTSWWKKVWDKTSKR